MMSSSKLELVTILTLVLVTVSLASAESKKGYGENCTLGENFEDPCEEDNYKNFRCYLGKCGCGRLLYEEDPVSETWSCVQKAPGTCPTEEYEGYKMKCTANAICMGFTDHWGLSQCSCKEGYHATPEGRCITGFNDLTPNLDDDKGQVNKELNAHDLTPNLDDDKGQVNKELNAHDLTPNLDDDKGQVNKELKALNGASLILTPLFNLRLALSILFLIVTENI